MSALEIADIIGIICFALSGFLIAVHYKLDILGVFISSFLTALGGGMIRDVLADNFKATERHRRFDRTRMPGLNRLDPPRG